MGSSFNLGGNLFQSFSSGSGNFLSDYASIKNGSYARLLKSYYRSDSGSGATGSSSKTGSTSNVIDKILEERRNPKVSEEVTEANAKLTSALPYLNKSVSTLQNEDTYTTQDGKNPTDKVVSAMKNYVADYNNVVSAAKRSTLSGKTSYVANMMSSTSANADKLAEIGVTVNRDGTLSINEGKLKAADITKVQDLFSAKDITSYGSRISSRVQFANSSSGTTATDSKDTDKTDTGSSTTVSGAAALKTDGATLASDKLYEKIKDTNQYDVSKIFDAAKSFVNNYNIMFDKAESSTNSGVLANLSQIREKTSTYSNALKQFGITVDLKGRMQIDEETFKNSDMSKVQNFFKGYNATISTNVSLVDYYMTTNANATSGYTSAGAYNVQGSSRYDDFM